jgi:hypothetical protein
MIQMIAYKLYRNIELFHLQSDSNFELLSEIVPKNNLKNIPFLNERLQMRDLKNESL